ncbi:MAG: ABC transporter ATP-binding protein [Gammaproteobacteria bacterium]|nr:ABC transporter ATP-binding protein [Gammaproteobacteria bacterium]
MSISSALAVSLVNVSCIFGTGMQAVHAVRGVSLDIKPGEFFTLLGPSGSGKTTCLRMIGGFTLPTSGVIVIDGDDVSQLPPHLRPVNTVFQDYALFPHMTVVQNVAFALRVRGVNARTQKKRAMELLDTMQLAHTAERKPAELSGGQRQRVALARALIGEPKVLLLDEPLGALDLKLREQMQYELKSLQRKLGITFIFVTHDQHEALSMSDRVGVFNHGRLEQVADPQSIYEMPKTIFVANFIGAANVLSGDVAKNLFDLPCAMLRPERIVLSASGTGRLQGKVQETQYFGTHWRVSCISQGTTLVADIAVASGQNCPKPGDEVGLDWSAQAVHPLAENAVPAQSFCSI